MQRKGLKLPNTLTDNYYFDNKTKLENNLMKSLAN